MLNHHERNQTYARILRHTDTEAENFRRRMQSTVANIHPFNWLALGICLLCLLIGVAWQ